MSSKIAIVGAGFLGLTLALRYAERGHRVTVFESGDRIGGLAAAWNLGEMVWDKHYHVTLLSDSYTRRIVEELGLESEFEWVETRTGFYADGELYSMSNSLEFLRFPPLGLVGKLRLGGTIFYAARVRDWKRLENVTVEEWLTKLSGRSTFEKIWKPLLKAKLGDSYRQTSAAFIWATIQRMYAARNSGLKKEMFGYVRGGYANILEKFGEVLEDKGVEIRLRGNVQKIERKEKGIFVESADILTDEFDRAILTCTPRVAERLLPQLGSEERAKLKTVRYLGIVCASIIIPEPLSDFYVTNIIEDSPFTGIIEMTAMVDRSHFEGHSLIYLPKYVAPDDPLFERDDQEIREMFLQALESMYPGFRADDVIEFRVSKVREVFPLPVIGYSEKLPEVQTSLEGIYVLNSSQITNGTLNVNETIQLAENFVSDNPIE